MTTEVTKANQYVDPHVIDFADDYDDAFSGEEDADEDLKDSISYSMPNDSEP